MRVDVGVSALPYHAFGAVGGAIIHEQDRVARQFDRAQLFQENRFRQDLLFRLNTVEITIPPLRERPDDIPEIAAHYAALYCRKYGRPMKGFSSAALDALVRYDWPGNVRALRHALDRAVILSEADQFELADFQLDPQPNQPGALGVPGQVSGPETDSAPGDDSSDDLNLERLEKRAIEKALQQHRYNISHAARELGLTRAALYRRMEKHGL